MNLRTEIHPDQLGDIIDFSKWITMMGSCFTENIGDKLKQSKFNVTTNPFGIIFNPIPINGILQRALSKNPFHAEEFRTLNSRWFSYNSHSILSRPTQQETLEVHYQQLNNLQKRIETTDVLILSWGTAWGYRHIETNQIVANCHKVPQKEFVKELIDIAEIVESTKTVIQNFKSDVKVIITVSPVRHWKDGPVQNSRSKARLIEAAHQLQDEGLVHYFPAYELLMDDLRDYRFYADDMLHPSGKALEYVWDKFQKTTMSEKTIGLIESIQKINRKLFHKFKNEDDRKDMIAKVKEEIVEMKKMIPEIKFDLSK